MSNANSSTSDSGGTERLTFSGQQFSQVDHFIDSNGNYIFCRYWKPTGKPKALVLIAHGIGEHSGRHNIIANLLVEHGFLVFSHDHVCHGESEGYRLDIKDYGFLLQGLLQHATKMKDAYPDLPIFLFGHSMGGGLAILLAYQNPSLFKGVVLSSPLIAKNREMTWIRVLLARLFHAAIPHLPVVQLDTKFLSRDPEQIRKYCDDPLVYHGKITLGTGYQMYLMSCAIEKILPEINFPFFVIHGKADGLCDVSGSEALYEQAKISDKKIQLIEGGFHELVHDTCETSNEFCAAVKNWLTSHL